MDGWQNGGYRQLTVIYLCVNKKLLRLTYRLFTLCSLRAWPLLHWHGQLSAQPPVPRDGHGPAWTLPRGSLPVLQAQLRPKDRPYDRHSARPTYRKGARGAHHPS